MFYSTDILTRRDGGFGLFWLVSTLGSKGGTTFKKLSKKEVIGANLVKACQKLIDPEEPFALRLSSNLLCGITRVYQQQYTIYQTEVNLTHQNLKKAFTDIFARSILATQSIDLPPAHHLAQAQVTGGANGGVGGGGGITLAIDPALAVVGYDIDRDLGYDWNEFGLGFSNGEERGGGGERDEGEIEFSSGVELRGTTPEEARERGPHQVRDKALITLQEPHLLDDFLLHQQDEHSLILGEEEVEFFGIEDQFDEVGLLEGLSPGLDAVLKANSARGGSRTGYRSTGRGGGFASSSIGGVGGEGGDMGGYDGDFFGDMDFGGGEKEGEGEGGETLEERVLREHQDGLDESYGVKPVRASSILDDRMDVDQNFDGSDLSNKRKSTDVVQVDAKPKKARKIKTAQVDSSISLTAEQVQASRNSYVERMVQEKAKVDQVKQQKIATTKGLELLFGVPEAFGGCEELSGFWKTNVIDQMVPYGQGKAAIDRKRFRPTSKNIKPEDDSGSPQQGRSRVLQEGQEDNMREGEGEYFDYGDFGGGGNNEEGRGEGGDMGGHDFMEGEMEQGRGEEEGNVATSQRNADLPWNRASDIGGFDPLTQAASSQTGTHLGKISLDTPNARIQQRQRSRTGSLLPSPLGSQAGRRNSQFQLQLGDGGLEDLNGMDLDGAEMEEGEEEEIGATQEAQRNLATLERESLNFLAYTKRQASEETSFLLFSDIVPVADTSESAAAQALYHLLALASKKLLKVKQDEPYGDIHVEIVLGL